MIAADAPSARAEWRNGWTVVLAALFGIGLTSSHVYLMGPFIAPIERDYGWTRAQISAGVGVVTFLGAVSAPFVGILLDRVGPRRVALPGAVVFCATLALMGLAPANVRVWWVMWTMVGVGAVMIKPTTWTMAVAGLFDRSRGLALAVTLCGTGLASSVLPILVTWLIDTHGWRAAYPLTAGIMALVVLPLFFLFFHGAADQRRRRPVAASTPPPEAVGATVREALRSARFAKLTLAGFVFTTAAIGITANLVPILGSMGLSRTEAAGVAGLAGLTSVIGRLGTGFLIDRFNGNYVGGICVLIPMIGCAMFLAWPGNVPLMMVAVIVLGLALGAELDIVAYLTTRHFGTARFGTIFGMVSSVWSLAVAVGPTLANHLYDRTGSYAPAIWAFLPLFAVASGCLFTLGPFPKFTGSAPQAGASPTS
ncbi:MFS transporter [Novosphingobium bradum]|uniref:MFS transporter n=1 Tax=Novosphingobium bradum TaxID=1737444 RepID=A0ABV7IJC8_9SPHN